MSSYTYEKRDIKTPLETYEWDNVWWEHAGETGVPRVLYIGDSISCGTLRAATAAAHETIYFDGLGTSKGIDNPYFYDTIRMFAAQQGYRQVILFNNGLHGWHLDNDTDYAAHYEAMIRFLQAEFPDTPLLLLLTTHVKDRPDEEDGYVIPRNRVVTALAEQYHLPIVDLYAITAAHEELFIADGVHLQPEGYALLAEELVRQVKPYISL